MNPIGIMQGRLLSPIGGRIQSFPVNIWAEEFARAQTAGLDCIEWIYEAGTDSANPLRNDEGVAEMQRQATAHSVAVWSICADYYMTERLISDGGTTVETVRDHLEWLIGRAGALGARYMVLPFVDSSSLRSVQERQALPVLLRSVLPAAERFSVELHLETDMQPGQLVTILDDVNHPLVRANYDIGNSASLGHDPAEELTLLRSWLGSVHVKDRVRGGSTVPLGTGSADLPTCFRLIHAADFKGPFILQVARQDGLSEVDWAVQNRQFVEAQMASVLSGTPANPGNANRGLGAN
jgi:hexulose-6-phosphate isomerase